MSEKTHEDVTADLVEQMMRFTKGIHRVKAQLTKEMPDRAAYSLLYPLIEHDKRAAELAEIIHSDPSTVSRHISHLVSGELVRRVPDQQDGRSALLSLTDKGRGLCEAMKERRTAVLSEILQHWPTDEAEQLTQLLARLNDDIEARHTDMVDGLREAFQEAEPEIKEPLVTKEVEQA